MVKLNRSILFISMVLAALLLSVASASFSIYGISTLFSGHFYSVLIMATTLEFSKFVLTSFLYRFWDHVSLYMKSYSVTAVIILMLITSGGIYGFLSDAYQKTKESYLLNNNEITLLKNKETYFTDQISQLKSRIDYSTQIYSKQQNRIDSLYAKNNNNVAKRVESQNQILGNEITGLNSKSVSLSDSLIKIKYEISQIENKNIKGELGPLVFISKSIGVDMDTVSQWFILLLIFVFDPLAIFLIIGVNYIQMSHTKSPERIQIPDNENNTLDDVKTESISSNDQQIESAAVTPVEENTNNKNGIPGFVSSYFRR